MWSTRWDGESERVSEREGKEKRVTCFLKNELISSG